MEFGEKPKNVEHISEKDYYSEVSKEIRAEIKYTPEEMEAFEFQDMELLRSFLDDMQERVMISAGREYAKDNFESLGLTESQAENLSYGQIKNMLPEMRGLDKRINSYGDISDLFQEVVTLNKIARKDKLSTSDRVIFFKKIEDLNKRVEGGLKEEDVARIEKLQESLWNSINGKNIEEAAKENNEILSVPKDKYVENRLREYSIDRLWAMLHFDSEQDDIDKKEEIINEKIRELNNKTGCSFSKEDILFFNEIGISGKNGVHKFNLFEQEIKRRSPISFKKDLIEVGGESFALRDLNKDANINNFITEYFNGEKDDGQENRKVGEYEKLRLIFQDGWERTMKEAKQSLMEDLLSKDSIEACDKAFELKKEHLLQDYLMEIKNGKATSKEKRIRMEKIENGFQEAEKEGINIEELFSEIYSGEADIDTIIDNLPEGDMKENLKGLKGKKDNPFVVFFNGIIDYFINLK